MRTKKLASLAAVAALATLFVSSAAKAEPVATTLRASGILVDGTGTTQTGAMAFLTVPDGADEDTLPDFVVGKAIVFKVGDAVICDGADEDHPSAVTDQQGAARCGLLLEMPEVLANGAKYTVEFAGDESYAAASDTGSLIWESQTGDILP